MLLGGTTACGLALVVGYALAHLSPGWAPVLVTFIGLALALPLVVRARTGRFDIFEPIVWLNFALGMMFVARPAADLAYGSFIWLEGYDIAPTFNAALLVAITGIAGMYTGYFSPIGKRRARRTRPLPDALNYNVVMAWSWALMAAGVVVYVVFAHGSLTGLIAGGIHIAHSEGSTSYFGMAPFLIVPAALLMMRIGLDVRRPFFVGVAAVSALVLMNTVATAGQRLWLMAIVLALAIYPILRSKWRPPVLVVALCIIPVFFVIVALRDRQPGEGDQNLVAAIGEAWRHPGPSWKQFILGPDTEMFNVLATELQIVPSRIPYNPSATVASIVTAPVPRALWPGKPYPTATNINAVLLGGSGYGYKKGQAGHADSTLGDFYVDGSYFGVFIEMMLVGVGWRFLYEYLRANPRNDAIRIMYAASLPLTIVLIRGYAADTLPRALFLVVPVVFVVYRARSRSSLQPLKATDRHPAQADARAV